MKNSSNILILASDSKMSMLYFRYVVYVGIIWEYSICCRLPKRAMIRRPSAVFAVLMDPSELSLRSTGQGLCQGNMLFSQERLTTRAEDPLTKTGLAYMRCV